MVTLASADNALKTLYLDVVANQLNTSVNPLLAKIQQTTSNVWGNEIRKLAPFGINGGIGAGSEDGELPQANSNNYAQFVLTLKNLYGTIEISDKAIRASQDNSGAFVNLLEAEMEGLLRASKFNIGRMLYGDGSGILCTAGSLIDNNVIYVDSVRNVMEGMLVDVISNTSHTPIVTSRPIVYVDVDDESITLGGAPIPLGTISSNDFITIQGSYNKELTGLGALFGKSETLYGLKRSSYRWLNPYYSNVSKVTDVDIQRAVDHIEEYAGSAVDFIVCSSGVKRTYQDYLVTNRTNIDVMNLQGGYKAISFNGIPVVSDRFVPYGKMYILNTSDFHMHQLCDWRWLEDDCGRVIKQVPNKPVYNATLVKYAELVCDRPMGQAVLSNISES